MLITFRSQAAGDVMMFDNVARQMLRIIGKEPADKGIITLAQLPAARFSPCQAARSAVGDCL